ncbi:MAG: hypothetical protein ACFE0O_12095 [Opitutales bacterium]
MSEAELLSLKQQLTKLTESERREVSAFIVRLGQASKEWKEETARRLDEMKAGKRTSVSELKDQIGHG